MRVTALFLYLVFAFALWSCETAPSKEEGPSLDFATKAVKEVSATCSKDSSLCTLAEATYPIAEGTAPAVQRINDSILHYVKTMLHGSVNAEGTSAIQTPEEAAKEFVALYDDFLLETPDYEMKWYNQVVGDILYRTDSLVTIELSNSTFTGGAHPNYVSRLMTFHLPDGRYLGLDDLVADKAALTGLAEQYFRQARELAPGSSLQDEGFFWGESFALPSNLGLTEDGLYFFYNSYEAAPYALGTTEFVIPYPALEGILAKAALPVQ